MTARQAKFVRAPDAKCGATLRAASGLSQTRAPLPAAGRPIEAKKQERASERAKKRKQAKELALSERRLVALGSGGVVVSMNRSHLLLVAPLLILLLPFPRPSQHFSRPTRERKLSEFLASRESNSCSQSHTRARYLCLHLAGPLCLSAGLSQLPQWAANQAAAAAAAFGAPEALPKRRK